MKRLAGASGLVVLFAVQNAFAAGATFDDAKQGLVLDRTALKTFDFESPDSLVGLELGTWADGQQGMPQLDRKKIASAADVGARLTTDAADAIEGSHALRLGVDQTGLLLSDQALFDQVKTGKFEVTLWARADGASPSINVLYDNNADSISTFGGQFATVRALRTGRQTNDGWAEFSTGPLDGNVWGVPVVGLTILPSFYADAKDAFLIDALEIRKVDGTPLAPLACTQQSVDATCGAEGDCMFGHCISSTVTWGALPSAKHRAEIAERWIQFSTRFIGDRNAAHNGAVTLAPTARDLAVNARSSRQFFGGLNRLVNNLRDNHTSFGSPSNFSSFAPQVQQGTASALGACFGVVEKDIMGGGLAYGVFRASDKPLTGTKLQRGDVVVSIDGRDPREWVSDVWPRFATTLPNDPASEFGPSANDLSRLVSTRASTITLARCASATDCSEGASRQLITIDVAKSVYEVLTNPSSQSSGTRSFSCTQRFSESVDASAGGGGGGDYGGEDVVKTKTDSAGQKFVSFDGFVGQDTWQSSMSDVFSDKPGRVVMDARMGHGGYYNDVQYLFDLVRGKSEAMGVISVGRGTYDMTDPPWLFTKYGACADDQATPGILGGGSSGADMWTCFLANTNGFFATQDAPPGAATKIAWLNTYDVSANDFMPRLLKGRTKFKIFAPHVTSGAFGAITELPGVATGWSGGSLQIQDSRFAPDLTSASQTRWESSHGVEPDVVVTEKLSDALNGVDTILQTATTWLAGDE